MNPLRKGLFWASSYTTFSARTGPVRKASEDRKARFFQILNPQAKAWGKCCNIKNIQSITYPVISVKSRTGMVGL